MSSLRTAVAVIAVLCLAAAGLASAGPTRMAESTVDDGVLDGTLARPETLTGRLVNMLPVEDPGTAGWQLQKAGRLITLDVSNVSGRVSRFQGQRVRMEGHYVFLGLGRTFVVTRIRRA